MTRKILYTLTLAIVCIAAATDIYAQRRELTPDQKLRMAQALIQSYYVEDVDGQQLTDEAIKAMLKTLDPHSSYTDADETKELTQPLEGKFSGIGIQFNAATDTVYVIQTVSGGPSEKVGIRPGDRIIAADDSIIAGRKLPNSAILKILRGEKGSKVRLKVKRAGVPELIEFVVTRDDIPIHSVDAAYMANDSTGYIRVSRFAEDTANEVAEAVEKLRKNGMRNLIIDLQDNGGGYLGAAVELASEFLSKGDPVVYTKGLHSAPAYFNLEKDGKYRDMRVVVMVNQYSASASEILSGALQDNDRGLIVGRRTFGKGLVQRPFPFPDGSMIRLTTARYYTPSGRSIQKHYEKGQGEEYMLDMLNRYKSGELWSANSIHQVDSLRYETLHNHRPVYGGGGIMPDVFVPVDTMFFSPYYRDLNAKGVINQFCLNYVDANREKLIKEYPTEDTFIEHFEITPELEQQLIAAGTKEKVEFNEEQWLRSRDYVLAVIKGLLSRDLYEDGSALRAINPLIPDYREALELINDTERYNKLLRAGSAINPAK
ncbi:MAG: S41 family peptidase [Muribaculaceae bacterium]|nr:S41 family peptidase [Muribaculaceae bacterium]